MDIKKSIIKFLILIVILVSGCSLDLKTKEVAKIALKEHSISVITNYFDLRYVENSAIAFGLLEGISKNIRIPLIFLLTISATFLGFYVIWRMRMLKFRFLLFPLFRCPCFELKSMYILNFIFKNLINFLLSLEKCHVFKGIGYNNSSK